MPDIWKPYPKLEAVMPWRIAKQSGKFCVVKESDGSVVKCHDSKEKAKSHLAALYVNEPSAAKKSVGYGMLKSLIEERVLELKGCGANKPGGGGFVSGNSCAVGGKSKGTGGGGEFKEGDKYGEIRATIPKPEGISKRNWISFQEQVGIQNPSADRSEVKFTFDRYQSAGSISNLMKEHKIPVPEMPKKKK